MTTEAEFLTEMRRVVCPDGGCGCCMDTRRLLELVDKVQEEMNCVLDYNLVNQELTLGNQRLQEQVRAVQGQLEECRHELERA